MKILLIGKDKTYLLDKEQKTSSSENARIVSEHKVQRTFTCDKGSINLEKAAYGKKIKTNTGYEFSVVKPTIVDLMRKFRRGPQIITTKDAATIIAVTGLSQGWNCLDAGSGSGYLSIFLANLIGPSGHITTYEKEKRFYEVVKYNIEFSGLANIQIKNKDASKFIEKNLDLVTLDMQNVEKIIEKCYKALKIGGWICIYSPHIEQQKKAIEKMEKCGFSFIQTIENMQRKWQVNNLKGGYSHPKYTGIGHTGFLTFGRKA